MDHLEKCGLFSDFQYGYRFCWWTSDLVTVVSDRIDWAFNKSGASVAVALDVPSGFDSNRWLWVALDAKSSQEYPVNAGDSQSFVLGPTLLLL